MNCDNNFFHFINYLKSNNNGYIPPPPPPPMNQFGSNFISNPYNATNLYNPLPNFIYSMNQRCMEIDKRIDELQNTLREFPYNYNNNNSNGYSSSSNSRYKRKRMNDYYEIDDNDNYYHRRHNQYNDNFNRYHNRNHRYGQNDRNRNRSNSRHRNHYKNNRYDSESDYDQDYDQERYHHNREHHSHKRMKYSKSSKQHNLENENENENKYGKSPSSSNNRKTVSWSDRNKNSKNIPSEKYKKKYRRNKKFESQFSSDEDSEVSDNDNDSQSDNESIDDNDVDNGSESDSSSSEDDRDTKIKKKFKNYSGNSRRNNKIGSIKSLNSQSYFYPKIKKEPTKKYLIVLDIFNMLYQRVTIDSVSSLIKINPHYQIKNAYIYLRPFLDTFLKELFNLGYDELGFEVAIWNSAKPYITKEITNLIFNNSPSDYLGNEMVNYMKKLHFIWTSDQCEPNSSDDDEAPKFVRNVETIVNNTSFNVHNGTIYPPVNEYGHWKKENIILVTSLNPKYFPKKSNYLCIPPYDVNDLQMEAKNDTSLLSLLQYLNNLLKENPSNVIDHLNSNQFSVQKKDSFGIIKSLKNANFNEKYETEEYPNKIRQTEFYCQQKSLEEMNIKTGQSRKKSNVIYKPIPSEPKNKYLIIFDLNGTLVHRLKNNSIVNNNNNNNNNDDMNIRKADFSINGKYVYVRPYIDAFIEALFDIDDEHKNKLESGFAIGTWTSAILKNSELMLNQILKIDSKDKKGNLVLQDYSNRIYFKWARDFCTPIPETDHETEKNMNNLWNHKKSTYCRNTLYPAVNEFGHWNEKNTIIIDDSPHKAKQYPYNAIHIPTFEITNKDSNSETVLLSLIKYLKKLYKSGTDNVQDYIKNHPFSKFTYDTSIDTDDTLSQQEKFDKLKETTEIKVKSKWRIKEKEEIEMYANGHSKFRKSRLQDNLFNNNRNSNNNDNGTGNSESRIKSFNSNNQNGRNKKIKRNNKKNKNKNKNNNSNNNNNNTNNTKGNNNNNNNDLMMTKLLNEQYHIKNIQEDAIDAIGSNIKKEIINDSIDDENENNNNNFNGNGNNKFNIVKNEKIEKEEEMDDDDSTIYDKDNGNDTIMITENKNINNDGNSYSDSESENESDDDNNHKSNPNNNDAFDQEFKEKFKDGHVHIDNNTVNIIKEISDFTNTVKSDNPTQEEPKLFKRGVFY